MSDQNQKQGDNRSATQKLTDLENAVMSLFDVNDKLSRDVMTLKNAIKLLDNKVNSIVKASTAGEPLTDEVLTRIMVENNVAELAQKVTNMVSQGFLALEDAVSENSFIVGSESDASDKVTNPRIQFALKSLSAEMQAKILGTKVGDTVSINETLKFKVLESYLIQEPKSSEAPVLAAVPDAPAEPVATLEAPVSQPDQPVTPTAGQ